MYKPKIKITREPVDWIVEAIGMVALLMMVALPLVYYHALPENIPSHFNALGEPDGFSGRATVWIFPATGLILYLGMAILNRYPHIFNYPVKITENNALRQYKNATRLIRVLNTVLACGFCYIVYATIQTASGIQAGLGKYFMAVFLTGVFGPIVFYFYKAIKEK